MHITGAVSGLMSSNCLVSYVDFGTCNQFFVFSHLVDLFGSFNLVAIAIWATMGSNISIMVVYRQAQIQLTSLQ